MDSKKSKSKVTKEISPTKKFLLRANGVRSFYINLIDNVIDKYDEESPDISTEQLLADVQGQLLHVTPKDTVAKTKMARGFVPCVCEFDKLNQKLLLTGERRPPIFCELCYKTFGSEQGFRLHKLSHVIRAEVFHCLVSGCNVKEPQAGRLLAHLRKQHKDVSAATAATIENKLDLRYNNSSKPFSAWERNRMFESENEEEEEEEERIVTSRGSQKRKPKTTIPADSTEGTDSIASKRKRQPHQTEDPASGTQDEGDSTIGQQRYRSSKTTLEGASPVDFTPVVDPEIVVSPAELEHVESDAPENPLQVDEPEGGISSVNGTNDGDCKETADEGGFTVDFAPAADPQIVVPPTELLQDVESIAPENPLQVDEPEGGSSSVNGTNDEECKETTKEVAFPVYFAPEADPQIVGTPSESLQHVGSNTLENSVQVDDPEDGSSSVNGTHHDEEGKETTPESTFPVYFAPAAIPKIVVSPSESLKHVESNARENSVLVRITKQGWWSKYSEDNIVGMNTGRVTCASICIWEGPQSQCSEFSVTNDANFDDHIVVFHLNAWLLNNNDNLNQYPRRPPPEAVTMLAAKIKFEDDLRNRLVIVFNGEDDFNGLNLKMNNFDVFDLSSYFQKTTLNKDGVHVPEKISLQRLVKHYFNKDLKTGLHSSEENAIWIRRLFTDIYTQMHPVPFDRDFKDYSQFNNVFD